MKKLFLLSFIFISGQIFSQNLSDLERQIIMASPEEMLQIVHNRSLESELNSIYEYFENSDSDDLVEIYSSYFPGITEEECMFLMIKLILVASLGSGNEYGFDMGLDILEMCGDFESSDITGLSEIEQALVNSTYWKDCMAFYKMFDVEAFIQDRFPEYL